MCLDRPMTARERRKFQPQKENGHFIGWKSFEPRGGGYLGSWNFDDMKCYSRRKWMNEKDYRPNQCQGSLCYWDPRATGSYPIGFHIYIEHDKRNFNQRKVYFRKAVAWGYQSGLPVVVAKELFIPKEVA